MGWLNHLLSHSCVIFEKNADRNKGPRNTRTHMKENTGFEYLKVLEVFSKRSRWNESVAWNTYSMKENTAVWTPRANSKILHVISTQIENLRHKSFETYLLFQRHWSVRSSTALRIVSTSSGSKEVQLILIIAPTVGIWQGIFLRIFCRASDVLGRWI